MDFSLLQTQLEEYFSVLIILAIFLSLWIVSLFFRKKTRHNLANSHTQSIQSNDDDINSTRLRMGFHVSGLTKPQISELNQLISRKDDLRLAMFIAIHQPTLLEIEGYVMKARDEQRPLWEHSKSRNTKSKFDRVQYASKASNKIERLRKSEQVGLIEHWGRCEHVIDRRFIEKFGNLLFMENFIMYDHLCHKTPAVFHIPRNNELRMMFNTFVRSGLAIQGKSIPISDRLRLLDLEGIRALARDIGVNDAFSSVEQAISQLSKRPATAVRLATRYASQDIFLLKHDENWDAAAVELEWSLCVTQAKLLCQ